MIGIEKLKYEFREYNHLENAAIIRIYVEVRASRQKFSMFNSEYEAYGVIREELNEFWHLVQHHDKKWAGVENMKTEIQSVAAMAVCYLIEINKDLNCDLIKAIKQIVNKYRNPNPRYPKVKSAHEAWAIMEEELNGYWDLVREVGDVFDSRFAKRQRIINLGSRAMKFLIEM